MSDDIINAIRLLVENGAEVTYSGESHQPTDYYQGVTAGRLTERERIIKLLEDDYESQDGIIWEQGHLDELIALIKGKQE